MSQAAIETGSPGSASSRAEGSQVAHRGWIIAFIIATAMPLTFKISGAHLNVHRAMMLLLIIPLFVGWASGRAPGKILLPDILIILSAFWMLLALLANHPPGEIFVFWLSQATETLGPYLLARLVIRDRESFLFFVKVFAAVVLFLLPFAMIESVTGRTVLTDIFEKVPGTGVPGNVGYGERLGLTRAQVTFEHPILYGAYCAIPLALVVMALKADETVSAIGRWLRASGIAAAVFFSLSSGALAAVVIPTGLTLWDRVLRGFKAKWHFLAGVSAAGYIFVSIVSNRPPIVVLISYVTFSASTAYNRVLIWTFGKDDVLNNPLFGIGLHDWSRPSWMLPSVDNFWLLWAMRYGLVGFLLLTVPIVLILRKIVKRDFSTRPDLAACRKGYVFAVIGVCTALATVAFWGGAYAMLCFMIGSGVWMMTVQSEAAGPSAAPNSVPTRGRYTRFAPSHQSRARPTLSRSGRAGSRSSPDGAGPLG